MRPKNRQERVERAVAQMKLLCVFLLIAAIGFFFADGYTPYRRFQFIGTFLFIAVLVWRYAKVEKIEHFSFFDRDQGDGMF